MTKIFTITVLLLSSFLLSAKDIITSGYYISGNGDTIQCKIVLNCGTFSKDTDLQALHSELLIIDSLNKKKVLKPQEIKGFYVSLKDTSYFFASFKNNFDISSKRFIFLKQMTKAYLSWFQIHSEGSGTSISGTGVAGGGFGGGSYYSPPCMVDILMKEGEEAKDFSNNGSLGNNYYKDLSEYFSDYPVLSIMIKNMVLKNKDMAMIVDYYNSWKAGSPKFDKDTTIYQFVDKPAEFDYFSGISSFERIKSYFNKKVNFHNTSMKVYFQAIVEKTGKLSNIKILRPVEDEKLKKQLLDVAASMETWMPARQNGKLVRSSVTFVVISE